MGAGWSGTERAQMERVGDSLMRDALDNLERDGHVALATFLVKGEQMHPGKKELSPVLPGGMGTAEQRELFGALLRALASTGKYDAIALVSEAWMAQVDNVSALASDMPDRKEVVMVQLSSRHGDLRLCARFERDEHGKPVRPRSVKKEWHLQGGLGIFDHLFAGA